jgi:energy-converting hydrogenase B subunit Q
MPEAQHSLVVTTDNERGTLARITSVIAGHPANITRIESLGVREAGFTVYLELELAEGFDALLDSLRDLPVVRRVEEHPSMAAIYGKQVVIIGGGAQVGQVAVGAVGEADRHNIRGERISVDTIPLVGEAALAEAVVAVARLPRARVLVLAGALMGGAITDAVREVQRAGIVVISLSMAGGVPRAADLVVGDPVLAGVMAVMAVADTASFDIERQRGRSY